MPWLVLRMLLCNAFDLSRHARVMYAIAEAFNAMQVTLVDSETPAPAPAKENEIQRITRTVAN